MSIYLCGPTVYGPPHLGHGRATLDYDVLVRYLRWTGLEVRLVSNVTDIDDQIINRANAEGRPWQEITERRARRSGSRRWTASASPVPTTCPHATE